jgi:predicted nucleotidyltransferase
VTLDELLAAFVAGARDALGVNFVAAYLAGSVALGAADEHSDVDFLVVTERRVDDDEQRRVADLHRRLYTLDTPWAQHLEGSYAPRGELRRPNGARWFFLDNGSTELVWDAHCNTALVRSVLLAHPVVLAGPPPSELVDPVSPAQLRDEARATLLEYASWAHDPHGDWPHDMSAWSQPYLVLTLCRGLFTLEHGRVGSKHEAAAWAAGALDERWRPLIEAAVAARPDPWERVRQPAAADSVAAARAFADHAAGIARS